jgi:hypothetical protein
MESLNRDIIAFNIMSRKIEDLMKSQQYKDIIAKPEKDRTEKEKEMITQIAQVLLQNKDTQKLLQEAYDLAMQVKQDALNVLQQTVPEAVKYYELDKHVE